MTIILDFPEDRFIIGSLYEVVSSFEVNLDPKSIRSSSGFCAPFARAYSEAACIPGELREGKELAKEYRKQIALPCCGPGTSAAGAIFDLRA